MHIDPPFSDGVLSAACRDHPSHLTGHPPTGQVPALHYDPRLPQRLDDGLRAQRAFQVNIPNLFFIKTLILFIQYYIFFNIYWAHIVNFLLLFL